ncbi:hypothetical protein AB0D27_28680 [Streptomyces sp. NPDC048415]|uniref:hypothetical protein n=1 Tax=Streptomyces sp. NPDC048415 TaxID=3154822 RepID=UPI003421CA9E
MTNSASIPGEIPGLLECLDEVPDPRDPRGVRHVLVVMLPPAVRRLDGASRMSVPAAARL